MTFDQIILWIIAFGVLIGADPALLGAILAYFTTKNIDTILLGKSNSKSSSTSVPFSFLIS